MCPPRYLVDDIAPSYIVVPSFAPPAAMLSPTSSSSLSLLSSSSPSTAQHNYRGGGQMNNFRCRRRRSHPRRRLRLRLPRRRGDARSRRGPSSIAPPRSDAGLLPNGRNRAAFAREDDGPSSSSCPPFSRALVDCHFEHSSHSSHNPVLGYEALVASHASLARFPRSRPSCRHSSPPLTITTASIALLHVGGWRR